MSFFSSTPRICAPRLGRNACRRLLRSRSDLSKSICACAGASGGFDRVPYRAGTLRPMAAACTLGGGLDTSQPQSRMAPLHCRALGPYRAMGLVLDFRRLEANWGWVTYHYGRWVLTATSARFGCRATSGAPPGCSGGAVPNMSDGRRCRPKILSLSIGTSQLFGSSCAGRTSSRHGSFPSSCQCGSTVPSSARP